MESILLMIAIDFHEQARREVGRLAGARTKLKAAGVECRLIDRRLAAAKEIELQLRDELLRFPVMTTQDAATKAAHLRQALKQDETTSEAGERYLWLRLFSCLSGITLAILTTIQVAQSLVVQTAPLLTGPFAFNGRSVIALVISHVRQGTEHIGCHRLLIAGMPEPFQNERPVPDRPPVHSV